METRASLDFITLVEDFSNEEPRNYEFSCLTRT